jgi:hypothetical protein
MMVSGPMIKLMDLEHIITLMVQYIVVSGKMIYKMDKVKKNGWMEVLMLAHMLMGRKKE